VPDIKEDVTLQPPKPEMKHPTKGECADRLSYRMLEER
jgi:hypothetical protein